MEKSHKYVFLADLIVLRLYYNFMSEIVTKFISPQVLFTIITNRVSQLIWPLYGFLQLYEQNYNKSSYLREFSTQISQSCVLRWFERFTAYCYCMSKNVTRLISRRVLCTSITNRVPSWFDGYTAFYNFMSKNITKLISPRVLCTSVTNRVFSWLDPFTAN